MERLLIGIALASVVLVAGGNRAPGAEPTDRPTAENPLSRWASMPEGPAFFPIGVWAQHPRDAGAYRKLGVNFYLGLYAGPTAEQVAQMRRAGMPFVCAFNAYARANLLDEPLAWGWMHRDEPDLAHVYPRSLLRKAGGRKIIRDKWPEVFQAQNLAERQYEGWGLAAHPVRDVQAHYKRIRAVDRTRPVLINFSRAVAYDGRINGRGDRSGHAEDYPDYIDGADWISFDIYPVAADGDEAELWRIARGLSALKGWGAENKPLMVILEAGYGERWASYEQQRAQAWLAISQGAHSIVWFCHRWAKVDGRRKLTSTRMPLTEPSVGKAVAKINAEIARYARIINHPPANDRVAVETERGIFAGARQTAKALYVFVIESTGEAAAEATIRVAGIGTGRATVVGEDRQVAIRDGTIIDALEPYAVRVYRIETGAARPGAEGTKGAEQAEGAG